MKAIHPILRQTLSHNFAAALVVGLAALLGACAAPTPPPAPAPPPVAAAQPAPPPPAPAPLSLAPADWRDAPRTSGDWRWGIVDGRSTASYGADPAAPVARLVCDRARGAVLLARTATASDAQESPLPMALTTTSGTSALVSDPALSGKGWLVIALKPGDQTLDAIAFSRGRFAFEAAGQPTLYLPSWPEVSRVIEDCR